MKELIQDHAIVQQIVLMFLILTCAVVVDLIAGVWKASKAGIATTSTGLKRTATKMGQYYLPMLCAACIDLMSDMCEIYDHPYFSFGLGAFFVLCELKSVMENTRTKEEMREAANTMQVVLKNKDDLAKVFMQVMVEQFNEFNKQQKHNEDESK